MCVKGFIVSFKLPFGVPILFIKKKNGGLKLCIDFRGLNAITKKKKHPLPLMQTLLDMLSRAKRYTKVDIIVAYHALKIWAGDKWKIIF